METCDQNYILECSQEFILKRGVRLDGSKLKEPFKLIS